MKWVYRILMLPYFVAHLPIILVALPFLWIGEHRKDFEKACDYWWSKLP